MQSRAAETAKCSSLYTGCTYDIAVRCIIRYWNNFSVTWAWAFHVILR